MKKILSISLLVVSMMSFSACGAIVDISEENTNTETNTETGTTAEADANSESVAENAIIPFADLNLDVMSINNTKEYKLIRFSELEGTCADAGFPTNLVYKTTNMIMTEDEKFVDQWTSVDFSGRISFNNLPLNTGNASCSIKTVKGVNTAQISCSMKEGEENKEVCTGSVKLSVEK